MTTFLNHVCVVTFNRACQQMIRVAAFWIIARVLHNPWQKSILGKEGRSVGLHIFTAHPYHAISAR